MKLSVSKSAAFIESPTKTLCLFLLYGPDSGLVRERGNLLAKKFVADLSDPFAVAELGCDTLAADPARLGDEMATLPMMGGVRLVRVRDAADSLFAAVDKALENPPASNAYTIIEAGDLDKRSKLRARIEDDPRAMAIPCYPEEGYALDKSIQTMLAADGFSAPRDILQSMTDLLPPDRIGVRHEIDKLLSYVYGRSDKRISFEDVQACLSDGHAETVDEAVWAAASVNLKRLDSALARLGAEEIAPVQLLRAMQRHLLKLYQVRAAMEDGQSMEEAIAGLRPPVFFKRVDAFRDQARRWSLSSLHTALHTLIEAESLSKTTGTPAQRLTERALYGLGKYAAR